MQEELCAGGVVLRGNRFLMLRRKNGVWLLPKGHVDPGEALEETAIREVEEETGLKATLGEKLGETSYSFMHEDGQHQKRVHWFVMESLEGDPIPEEGMFLEVRWMGMDEIDGLTFEHDRQLVRKAFQIKGKEF